ncbi:hypothetical protein OC834_003338 [Tilletia horrida]|nr:hypothetical protein OC834_003338 [Tilletia horrida]
MKIHAALFTSLLLAVSSATALTDVMCRNLCCKKVTTTKVGLLGQKCAPFTPGSVLDGST